MILAKYQNPVFFPTITCLIKLMKGKPIDDTSRKKLINYNVISSAVQYVAEGNTVLGVCQAI